MHRQHQQQQHMLPSADAPGAACRLAAGGGCWFARRQAVAAACEGECEAWCAWWMVVGSCGACAGLGWAR